MSDLRLFENALLGERYYTCTHRSGLPIYVFPKKMSTTYAVLAVRYGSLDNLAPSATPDSLPAGVAHFLEHKLFLNEDGSDSFERFSALGADANAYTAYNRTAYLFSCTDHFGECLGELLDFATHPYFTEESVEKEKGIIAEEIRMCMDDPYDRCYQQMLTALYHAHPIREEICGSERSISEITAPMLYETYRAFYTLSNMALIVCGDVEPDEVIRIADAHLPDVGELRSKVPRFPVDEPDTVVARRVQTEGQVAKPIFCIGIKDTQLSNDPAAALRRDLIMDLLCEMLFSDTGELYNSLYDRHLISPGFGSTYARTRGIGYLQLTGEAGDPDAVLREILVHLAHVIEAGLDEKEFERARRILFAEHIKSFDSTEEIAEMMLSFLVEGVDVFSYHKVLSDIRFEELSEVARSFFDPSRTVLSFVTPQT